MTKTIKYHRNLVITNLDQLPHGVNAKYLEVIVDNEHGVLIAKQWRRKQIKTDSIHALVQF